MNTRIPAIGYYTAQDQVILTGTSQDITLLSHAIVFKGLSATIPLFIPDDPPEPYQGFLREIQVFDAEHPLRFTSKRDILVIAGSLEQRKAFAYEILQLAEETTIDQTRVERHRRIQYYPGHPFLSVSTLAVIVSVVSCGGEPVCQDVELPGNSPHFRMTTATDC